MTDKEAIKYLQQLYPNGGHCWLDEQRIEAIGMAIQALQEKPISEQNLSNVQRIGKDWKEEPVSVWHDTSENPKEEEYLICVYKDNRYHIGKLYKDEFGRLLVSDNMNIIELCMFEKWAYLDDILKLSNIERTVKDWKEPVSEKKCMFTKDSYTDEDRKILCYDCKEKCEYSKKEEHVSEDTMTIRKEWFEHCKKSWYNEGYIDGKYNRDRQFKEPVSEELEDAAVEIARKELIDKAVGWIKEINNHHHIMRYSDSCEPPLSELTEWFKNYMKEENINSK